MGSTSSTPKSKPLAAPAQPAATAPPPPAETTPRAVTLATADDIRAKINTRLESTTTDEKKKAQLKKIEGELDTILNHTQVQKAKTATTYEEFCKMYIIRKEFFVQGQLEKQVKTFYPMQWYNVDLLYGTLFINNTDAEQKFNEAVLNQQTGARKSKRCKKPTRRTRQKRHAGWKQNRK